MIKPFAFLFLLPALLFFSCTPPSNNEKIKLPLFSKTPIYFTAQLDSTITKDTTKYFFVKAIFYNNTAGTVYFKSNTCSGPSFFITNNTNIKFEIPMCFQSVDFWDTLPSFKSKVYPLVFSTNKEQPKEKTFTIGIDLKLGKYMEQDPPDMDPHIIWSNAVPIK